MRRLSFQGVCSSACLREHRSLMTIFSFNCPYVSISTLLTEFPVLVATAGAAHSGRILCHKNSPPMYYFDLERERPYFIPNERHPFSSSLEIRLVSTSADTSYIPTSFVAIAFTI